MKIFIKTICVAAIVIVSTPAISQTVVDTALENKASEWAASLKLNDDAKTQKVKTAIGTHLTDVKEWHNSHPFTLTPEGINPTTGGKLSEMGQAVNYLFYQTKIYS